MLGGLFVACAAERGAGDTEPGALGGAAASEAAGHAGSTQVSEPRSAGGSAGVPSSPSAENLGAGAGSGGIAEGGAAAAAGQGGARALGAPANIDTVSPAADELHVAPLATITLHLSGPIDANSLALEPVKLFGPHASAPLSAVVKYDSVDHRIELTPTLPLAAGSDHRIVVEGLVDLAGRSLEWHSQFRVAYQSRAQELQFDEDGALIQGALYELDAQGRITNRLSIGNVGPDVALGTADDVPSYRIAYEALQSEQRQHHANHPGPDAVWNSADDGFFLHVRVETGPLSASRYSAVQGPGPDGALWTADDVFQDWGVLSFRSDGRAIGYDWFAGIGPDQLRFTTDDVLKGYQRYDYGPGEAPALSGFSLSTSYRSGVGVDGLWRTADDPCTYHRKTLLDARGLELGTLFYGPGADGSLCSPDDVVTYAARSRYTERWLLAAWEEFGDAGADGIWLTADDSAPLSRYLYDYDAEGRMTKSCSYYPGPDGSLGTKDDSLASETLFDPR
jgi:hypothetical protein